MNFLHKTWAEIDASALKHNYNEIKSHINGGKIMAVVKANAYGHSAIDVAPLLEKSGVDAFAVSNLNEAISLRECGIKKDILILGYTPVEEAKTLYENNIIQSVFSYEYAKDLATAAKRQEKKIKIHIKLDTGMGRIGFDCRDDTLKGLEEAMASAKMSCFELCGIFTHFADSDRTEDTEDGFTDCQYQRFKKAVDTFIKEGFSIGDCHCCNSAATLADADKYNSYCRTGIIMYGLTPSSDLKLNINLIPVMSFKTVVTMVKNISAGTTISYGRTYIADKNMKVATLAVGYADGYPRMLSNRAYVLINGKKANVVGRVCMDQVVVDVSDIEDVKMGDEVLLFGKDLPVEELAGLCDTINYEMVCNVSARVPRVIVNI